MLIVTFDQRGNILISIRLPRGSSYTSVTHEKDKAFLYSKMESSSRRWIPQYEKTAWLSIRMGYIRCGNPFIMDSSHLNYLNWQIFLV